MTMLRLYVLSVMGIQGVAKDADCGDACPVRVNSLLQQRSVSADEMFMPPEDATGNGTDPMLLVASQMKSEVGKLLAARSGKVRAWGLSGRIRGRQENCPARAVQHGVSAACAGTVCAALECDSTDAMEDATEGQSPNTSNDCAHDREMTTPGGVCSGQMVEVTVTLVGPYTTSSWLNEECLPETCENLDAHGDWATERVQEELDSMLMESGLERWVGVFSITYSFSVDDSESGSGDESAGSGSGSTASLLHSAAPDEGSEKPKPKSKDADENENADGDSTAKPKPANASESGSGDDDGKK